MVTNIRKVDGRWIVETGAVVVVNYVRIAVDDYDIFLSEQVKDICTGELLAINKDFNGIEHLVPFFEELPEYRVTRKASKKSRRAERINNICGTHYDPITGIKKFGKNRRLSRRMLPNPNQLAEYEQFLPF